MYFNINQLEQLGCEISFARDEITGLVTAIKIDGKRPNSTYIEGFVKTLQTDYPGVDHDILMALALNMFDAAFSQQLLTIKPIMVSRDDNVWSGK